MLPSIGRIVHYVLNESDAASINKRRADARSSDVAQTNSGAVVHSGNSAAAGDEYPAVIVRLFGASSEDAPVNLQVLLDGNDTYWATSRKQAAPGESGSWHEPERGVQAAV